MSVENLTVPSSEISTRGVVPRTPMVATGVSTFMSPVFATLPATKVKSSLGQIEQGRVGRTVWIVHELVQNHARVVRQIEGSAIGEVDADPAVGAGRDGIALIDEIAYLRLTGLTGGTRLNDHRTRTFKRDRTGGDNNFSNWF